ncbi:hypothetical protein F0U59_23400 [Archangium gephyra]|nr:hypothetical protein F0U59_23400 [Archangium gephyra]
MSFLTLNGISFPCVTGNAVPVRAGELERSANLSVRSGVRALAWDLPCATGELSQAEARAVRGLVEGEGHSFSFADTTTATSFLWSSRGLVPWDTEGAVSRATGGRWASRLRLLDDASAAWAFGVSSEWTVSLWYRDDNSPTWKHYTICSSGSVWVNGVVDANPTPPAEDFLSVDLGLDGTVRLRSVDGADSGLHDYSEVLVLPYVVPDAWGPLLYAFSNTRPWPALPFLRAEGAAVPGGVAEVLGQVGTVERLVGGPGVWVESFDFTLVAEP